MRFQRLAAALCAASMLVPTVALADEPISFFDQLTDQLGNTYLGKQIVSAAHPLPVTGGSGFSAFSPDNASLISPNATTTSSNTALALGGSSGSTVKFTDTGSVAEHYRLCPTNTCTATTSDDRVQPGIANYVSRGSNLYIAFITDSGSTTNDVVTGSGGGVSGVNANLNSASSVTPTATELHLGEVGGNQLTVAVSPTVTASSAYTAGNAIGGLMTISSAARVSGTIGTSGTGGLVQSVAVGSKSAQTTQVDVFLFDANPSGSTCTDKTAFALAAADVGKLIGVASIPATTGWYSGGTPSVGQAANLALPYSLSSSTTIYACAVTRATPTFGSTSDLTFKFGLLRG